MPASSRLWRGGQKKELLGPALFCSRPHAGDHRDHWEPAHNVAGTTHRTCFGGENPKMLCLGGAHELPHPTTDPDVVPEKRSFHLKKLERPVLMSSSYKGWFPRLRPVTKKIQSHFWQQLKISDSSLRSPVPQFPFQWCW